MKDISSMKGLVNRMQQGSVVVDGGASRTHRVINEDAERIVDRLFVQLKTIFPAAQQTNFRTEDAEKATKQQWVLAFVENGIGSIEQLKPGMRRARASEKPFWPAPGEFIKWCREGSAKDFGLPEVDAVISEFRKYCNDRSLYDAPEDFPWAHPVMYWIIPVMRLEMTERNLAMEEIKRLAHGMLMEWVVKLQAGEQIPAPVVRLENKVRPPSTVDELGLGNEEAKKRGEAMLARIRAKNGKQN